MRHITVDSCVILWHFSKVANVFPGESDNTSTRETSDYTTSLRFAVFVDAAFWSFLDDLNALAAFLRALEIYERNALSFHAVLRLLPIESRVSLDGGNAPLARR